MADMSAPRSRVTFVHSADWQLGMVRAFLGPEAQARYGQARIDAIERIGQVAAEAGAAFVVVAGDVFDANQVDRHIVLRACEALKTIQCPVYLLPGNHDSLEPGSVWTSPILAAHLPSHVEIVTDTTPRTPVPGVEVVGLPWRTRRPYADPMAELSQLEPTPDGVLRVAVGHGQVDIVAPENPTIAHIELAGLEAALADGRIHFAALGDHHSVNDVGTTGRIWYSGTPEPTRPEETDPGKVLRVDLSADGCEVTPIEVGTWRLLEHIIEVDGDSALDQLEEWLGDRPDKARTVVRLGVSGTLSVAGLTRLEMLLDAHSELYAAIQRRHKRWSLQVLPDDAALDSLSVSGPARAALDELRLATGEGDGVAADALALLHRLAGGAA
jgi:DNA repair exonuclease SbcCD nuclease subunit